MENTMSNHIVRKKMTKERVKLLLFALPFVLFIFAFSYVPLFGWAASFFSYKPGLPLTEVPFVGLKYFRMMFTTEFIEIKSVLTNTLAFFGLSLLIMPLPILLAILLNEVRSRKFKRVVQTITTLPHFISWVIIFSLVFSIFSSEGMMNRILLNFGLVDRHVRVLDNKEIVWYFQTALTVWKTTGWNAIIYIAAIAGIETEQYEAAQVDGAGRFKQAIHITIPGIMPTFIVLFLLAVGYMLSAADLDRILVFHNGVVAPRIETIDYYVYRMGIQSGAISYSTAIGMIKSLISITLLFGANFVSKKVRGVSIF